MSGIKLKCPVFGGILIKFEKGKRIYTIKFEGEDGYVSFEYKASEIEKLYGSVDDVKHCIESLGKK